MADRTARPPTVVQTPWLIVMSLTWNAGQGERSTTFHGTPKFLPDIRPSEIFAWTLKAARQNVGLDPQTPIVVRLYHAEPDLPANCPPISVRYS